jgi:hypothetical protein
MRGAKMDVENVNNLATYTDVRSEDTSLLSVGNGQIDMTGRLDHAATEGHVAVNSPSVLASFSDYMGAA